MLKKYFFAAAVSTGLLLGAATPDNGFVTVGKTVLPVKIDGQINEAAWQQGITLTPFMVSRQNRPATQQTKVKMLWDDQYLYIYFQCHAKALNPLENRLHDFKANVKDNDKPEIVYDESVLLMLLRGDKMYDFIFNSNGAVTDSTSTVKNLWVGRDLSWNSGAVVATGKYDRDSTAYYTVEAAIPWTALGGTPVKTDHWRFNVYRWGRSAKEESSFQIMVGGAHNIHSTSRLKFSAAPVPELSARDFPALTPGANPWEFRLDGKKPLKITARVQFDQVKPERFSASGKKASLTVPIELKHNGDFTFSYQVENPASFSEYLKSPVYKFRVSANVLKHNAKNAAITVNGQAASREAVLGSGLNTVEIKGQLAPGEYIQVGDHQLTFANNNVNHLLLEDSLLWPNWLPEGITMSANGLQQILFVPRGVKGFTLQDYTMNFDLPEGYEVVGVSGYYKVWQLSWKKSAGIIYNGKKFNRFSITLNKPVKFNANIPNWQWVAVFVKAPALVQDNMFYYHASSQEKQIQELPNCVKIKMLPELKGIQPEKLIIQLWAGWLSELDNKELYKYLGDSFKAVGFNETGGVNNRVPGLRHFQLISFQNWNFSCVEYARKHPEKRLQNPFKKFGDSIICSTAMVQDADFKEYFYNGLKAWHEKWHRPHTINWDYESRVFESYLACFCDRCLKDFQQFAKLDTVVDAQTIRKQHAHAWALYMNKRMAEMSDFFNQAIKKLLPGIEYSIYSAYQSEQNKSLYGLDWSLLRGKTDYAACGYSRNEEELRATREAIQKMPLMIGELLYPHQGRERYAPKAPSRATIMRRACDGTRGILLYEYSTFDARTMDSVAAVSRIMSRYEDLFINGKRNARGITLLGFDPADYEVLQGSDGALLIALMNPTSAPRKFNFTLNHPVADKLLNVTSGKVEKGKSFSGTIAANDFVIFTNR